MKECEPLLPTPLISQLYTVYRINWLQAKARVTRWEEEARLVPNEMSWTVNWLLNKAKKWTKLTEASTAPYL